MEWTIQPINVAEAERLLPLQKQVQAVHAAAHPDIFRSDIEDGELRAHLRDWLSRTEVTALAALAPDGAVLGHIIYEIERLERSPLRRAMVRGHLHQIVVDRERRRTGIGSALVAAMMAQLRAEGVDRVVASYFAFNEASAALMRKAGFVPLYVQAEAPVGTGPGTTGASSDPPTVP